MKKSLRRKLLPRVLAPCLLPLAATAAHAAIVCQPSVVRISDPFSAKKKVQSNSVGQAPKNQRPAASSGSQNVMADGQKAEVVGNCTDSGAPLNTGWEVWVDASHAEVGRRALPAGPSVDIVPSGVGDHTYMVYFDPGYGGPIVTGNDAFSVTLTVTSASTPAPAQANLDQLSGPLTTAQTERIRTRLSQVEERLRAVRANPSLPEFDTPGIPLPAPAQKDARRNRLSVYVAGLDDYLKQDATANQSEFRVLTTALMLGAD